jgi:hypothetical protein
MWLLLFVNPARSGDNVRQSTGLMALPGQVSGVAFAGLFAPFHTNGNLIKQDYSLWFENS